jgi:hypothetical protein
VGDDDTPLDADLHAQEVSDAITIETMEANLVDDPDMLEFLETVELGASEQAEADSPARFPIRFAHGLLGWAGSPRAML